MPEPRLFRHQTLKTVAFIEKDTKRFPNTHGWAYAQWAYDPAAYGDFATGLLAILALLTVRTRPVFWLFVVAFNLVGSADLIIDYYNATQLGLSALAGELGSTYVIPIIYVPLLMITHVVAFYLVVRQQWTAHRVAAANVAL